MAAFARGADEPKPKPILYTQPAPIADVQTPGSQETEQQSTPAQREDCKPKVAKVSNYHPTLTNSKYPTHIWIPTSPLPPVNPDYKFDLTLYYGNRDSQHTIGSFTKVEMSNKTYGGTMSVKLTPYKNLSLRMGADFQTGKGSFKGRDTIDLGIHNEKRLSGWISPEVTVPLDECTWLNLIGNIGFGKARYKFEIDDHLITQREDLDYREVSIDAMLYRILADRFKMGIGVVAGRDYFTRTVKSQTFNLCTNFDVINSYEIDVSKFPVIEAQDTVYGVRGNPVLALGSNSKLSLELMVLARNLLYENGPAGFSKVNSSILGLGTDYNDGRWGVGGTFYFHRGDVNGTSFMLMLHTPSGMGVFFKYVKQNGFDTEGLLNPEKVKIQEFQIGLNYAIK